MKKYHFLALAILLVFVETSVPRRTSAQQFDQLVVASRITAAMGNPLPAVADILGPVAGKVRVPGVLFAPFENGDGSEVGVDWGEALGDLLRDELHCASRQFWTTPTYNLDQDLYSLRVDRSSKTRRREYGLLGARRLGAQYVVAGDVTVREDSFRLTAYVVDAVSGKELDRTDQRGSIAQLPAAIAAIGARFLQVADIVATPVESARLASIGDANPGALRALAEYHVKMHRAKGAVDGRPLLQGLRLSAPDLLPAILRYEDALAHMVPAERLQAELATVAELRADSVSLQALSSLRRSQAGHNRIDPQAVRELAVLTAAHPECATAWQHLSLAYSYEEFMYGYTEGAQGMMYVRAGPVAHHEGYAKAIAIALEAARRWPDDYRNWWMLSYGLGQYASALRGAAPPENVDAATHRRFAAVMRAKGDALDRAIRLHDENGKLYEGMIPVDLFQGRDWMEDFRRAAKLNPHDASLYQIAFNYARPHWGGDKDMLQEIYSLAKKNNPGEDWPRTLRNAWAREIKPIVDWEDPLVRWGALAIVVVAVGAFVVRRAVMR